MALQYHVIKSRLNGPEKQTKAKMKSMPSKVRPKKTKPLINLKRQWHALNQDEDEPDNGHKEVWLKDDDIDRKNGVL